MSNVRGYAQVRQDAVEADAELSGVILDEAEVVVDQGQPRVIRCVTQGIPITIEGDDARAIV